jgi:hypothetical protein
MGVANTKKGKRVMEKMSVVEAIGLRDVELGKVHTIEEALKYLEEQRKLL